MQTLKLCLWKISSGIPNNVNDKNIEYSMLATKLLKILKAGKKKLNVNFISG